MKSIRLTVNYIHVLESFRDYYILNFHKCYKKKKKLQTYCNTSTVRLFFILCYDQQWAEEYPTWNKKIRNKKMEG